MGCDGTITIWKVSDVLAVFPLAEELMPKLPTSYRDTLQGEEYYHCYRGDNLMCDWRDSRDWYVSEKNVEELAQLKELVEWLEQNSLAEWEVWT